MTIKGCGCSPFVFLESARMIDLSGYTPDAAHAGSAYSPQVKGDKPTGALQEFITCILALQIPHSMDAKVPFPGA
jgi:hypothetical protein